MTKAEKRYFKMQTGLQKGEKEYLKLFDAMDNLPFKPLDSGQIGGYDEALLKKQLKGKMNTAQLHVTKNYLYGLVLKALRTLHEKTSTEEQLSVLLAEARTLEQRGLYDQVNKKIISAKNIALKYEKHLILIEIHQLETIICAKRQFQEVKEELDKLYSAIHRHLGFLEIEIQYKSILNHVTTLYRKGVRSRDEPSKMQYDLLISSKLLLEESIPSTFLSKISYHCTKALLAILKGDTNQGNQHYKNLFNVWSGYPHFKEEYPSIYIIHTSNYLVGCHLLGDYSLFSNQLNELKQVQTRNFDEAAEAFQNIYFLEQLYFMNCAVFDANANPMGLATKLADSIAAGLQQYASRIVKARQLSFFHNTAIMFFAIGDFDKSLEWLSKVQQSAKTDQRKDLQLFARLLQLIIFTENGEHLYIDNAFKSFEYHLKKEDKSHDFEGKVTRFLKQVVVKKEDKKKLFMDFREELTQFEMLKLPGFEEISIWVESKIRNLPFLEILREKVKEKETKKGPR